MKSFFYILLFLFAGLAASAQNNKELAELKAKSEKAKKEIEQTRKLIKQAERDKEVTVQKLSLIQKQIALREEYVTALQAEIRQLEREIYLAEAQIRNLESELEIMQQEYKLTLFTMYKLHNAYDEVIFVLSSEDLNQAYNRLQYLQYYSDFMIKQSEEISFYKDSLSKRIDQQKELIANKTDLLQAEENQKIALSKDKNKERQTLQDIESQQGELKRKLAKKRKEAKELDEKITKIIEEEIARSKNTTTKEEKEVNLIISKNFAENKGRLPWPTNNGSITLRFGKYQPKGTEIILESNGIEITASTGTKARAVFEGTVARIVVIPGKNTAVLIKHGEYYTVYNNLVNVSVKPGQKVRVKQEIGTIYTNPDSGLAVMELQIWKNLLKLDPQPWLQKK